MNKNQSHDSFVITQLFQYLYNAEDIGESIGHILEILGSRYGLSRIYINEDKQINSTLDHGFCWCAPGITECSINIGDLHNHQGVSRAYSGIFDENNIGFCPNVSALPEELGCIFSREGIKGFLLCNIVDNGIIKGVISFDDCKGDMAWTDEIRETLSLIAMMIGTFLTSWRKQTSALLSEDFMAAFNYSTSYIYIIEPQTYKIIYINKTLRDRFPDLKKGCICYNEAIGCEVPCGNCPIMNIDENGDCVPTEILRKDGVWMLSQASRIHWNGKIMHMITCVDITVQKRAEADLIERNNEYAAIIKQSGKHVFRYNIKTGETTTFHYGESKPLRQTITQDYVKKMIETEIIAPESVEDFLRFFREIGEGIPSGCCDVRTRSAQGEIRWKHADYSIIYDAEGNSIHAIISYYDNTEEREKAIAYEKWQDSLNRLLSENAIYLEINLTRDIIEREENLGRENQGREGKRFTDYIAYGRKNITWYEDEEAFLEFFDYNRLLNLYDCGHTEDHFRYRAIIDGKPKWYRTDIQMVKYPDSEDIKAFIVYTDIDEEMKAQKRISDEASLDSMTGLLNRGAMEKLVKRTLCALGHEDSFALFMLDIDNFKNVNDAMGHQQGDNILIKVAQALKDEFRSDDFVCRFGGDEYMVFITNATDRTVIQDKAKTMLKNLRFFAGGIDITVSIGVCIGKGGNYTFDRLYGIADKALYKAKEKGKNTFIMLESV